MAKYGTLTIKMDLDAEDLKKDIKSAQRALEDYDKKNQTLANKKLQLRIDAKDAQNKLAELDKKLEYLGKKGEILEEKIASAKTPLAKEQLELQLDAVTTQTEKVTASQDELNDKMNEYQRIWSETLNEIEYNERAQEHIKDNISDMSRKLTQAIENQNKLTEEAEKTAKAEKKATDEGGRGFEGLGKKIAKIGLGLVGLRTGLFFLRSAVSTLASQNDDINTKINTMKAAIANGLAPVVNFVINLFKTLLAYIGYIYKAWTGVNIFAKDTAKNTKKMKNNLGGANKEANKLKRTLAGFDEMNILQKDGGTSTGGGGGGVANDIDMSMFDDVEIPEWVKWIADNKESVLSFLKQVAAILATAFVLGSIVAFISKIKELQEGIAIIKDLLGGMSGLQIFAIIAGVAITIKGIIDLVGALSSDIIHLEDVLGGVGEILIGLGLIVAAFTPWGWIGVGLGLLAELASALIDTRTEEEKLEEANKRVEETQRAVNDAYKEFTNANKTHLNAYKNLEKAKANVSKTAKQLGIDEGKLNEIGADLFEGIRNGTIDINTLKRGNEDLTETYKLSKDQLLQVYESYIDLKDSEAALTTATDKLTTTQENLTEKTKEDMGTRLAQKLQLFEATGQYDELGQAMEDAYKSGSIGIEELSILMSNAMDKMDEETKQTFAKNLPADLKIALSSVNDINGALSNTTAKSYVLKFGMDTSDVQKKIDEAKRKISQLKVGKFFINVGVQSANGSVLFANGGLLGLPRLAPGGVVNNPGPGVNYRGANMGEKGPEAVVPLTNSQMMGLLGEAIARHINLKAEVPVYIGNRQVAREIRNINAEDSFAYNG